MSYLFIYDKYRMSFLLFLFSWCLVLLFIYFILLDDPLLFVLKFISLIFYLI